MLPMIRLLSYINPPSFLYVLASSHHYTQFSHQVNLKLLFNQRSPSTSCFPLHDYPIQSAFQSATTLMPRNKGLGTPKCCAEYRAWFAVHLQRCTSRTRMEEAFNDQFPDNKLNESFGRHLKLVRKCGADVRSQLLDLAKEFSW